MKDKMVIYIAGKIEGQNEYRAKFNVAEEKLIKKGHIVIKPTVLPLGLDHAEYLHINYAMIDVCDCIYFLNNWQNSKGAILEHRYAERNGKKIQYQLGIEDDFFNVPKGVYGNE